MPNPLATAFVRVQADMQGFAQRVKTETAAVSNSIESNLQTTVTNTGRTLQSAGDTAIRAGQTMSTGVTLPIVGAGFAMLRTAADFEKSMNAVQAVSGATGQEIQKLEGLAVELGSSTMFSASEAAGAMYELSASGLNVGQTMTALPGVLDLAAAGQLALADAAAISSDILAGYGLEVSELGRVNDVLTQASISTSASVQEIGQAMSFVAPVAQSAGLEFEEVAATIGSLSDAGIKGTRAGTSLRMAITRLISPVGKADDILKELGIQVRDSSGSMLPLNNILGQLRESGASTAQIMRLFGQEAGPAMQALISQGEGALTGLTEDLRNAGGTAQRVAEVQMEGLRGGFDDLTSALEGLAIAIADSGLLEWATKITERVTEFLRQLSKTNPELLKLGTIVALAAAAIGPAVLLIGGMVKSFGGLLAVVGRLGPLMTGLLGPIGLIAAGIAVLVAASPELRALLADAFRQIVNALKPLIPMFQQLIRQIMPILQQVLKQVVQAAKPVIAALVQLARRIIPIVIQAIMSIVQAVLPLLPVIGKLIATVFQLIRPLIELAVSVIPPLIRIILSILVPVIKFLIGVIRGIITVVVTVARAIINNWGLISSITTTVFGAIGRFFTFIWNGIRTVVMTVVNTIWRFIQRAWNTVSRITKAIWNGIKAYFSTVFAIFKAIFTGDFGKLKDIVQNQMEAAERILRNIWNRVKDFLGNLWDNIVDAAGRAFGRLVDRIKGPVRTVIRWINDNIIDNINKVTSLFGLTIGHIPVPFNEGGVAKPRGGRFNRGGIVPGQGPDRDSVFATLTPGESILTRRTTHMLGGERTINALNGAGGPLDWLKENIVDPIGEQIGDWLRQGAAFALDKIMAPVVGVIRDLAPAGFVQDFLSGIMEKFRDAIVAWGEDQDAEAAAAGAAGAAIAPSGWARPLGRGYRIGRGPASHGYPARDFPAPIGTPIFAVQSGNVFRAARLSTSYGHHAMISHQGLRGVYAHMSRLLVSAGDIVRAGQKIGLVGSTGNSTGPHLHLELGRFDPLTFLRNRGVSLDSGGTIPPGYSLVHNGTGGPETLRPVGGPGHGDQVIENVTVQVLNQPRTFKQMMDELALMRAT